MTSRYSPPPEVQKAANARAALRERTKGRTLTRDEKRLDQRYASVLDPFHALTAEQRMEQYAIPEAKSAATGAKVKTCAARVKVADGAAEGRFTALVSAFGNVDLGGDVVMPGAFADSLAAWKASGDPIPVSFSHDWSPNGIIGKVADAVETADGLQVTAEINMKSPNGPWVYEMLKDRLVTQFSFAYEIEDARPGTKDGQSVYELHKLNLIEVGPTLQGMNPATQLLDVKAAPITPIPAPRSATPKGLPAMNLKDQRAALFTQLKAITDGAEGRDYTDEETAEFETKSAELETLDARIAKAIEMQEKIKSLSAMPLDDDEPDFDRHNGGTKAAGSTWTKRAMKAIGTKSLLAGPVTTDPMFIATLPEVPTSLLDLITREAYSAATVSYLRQTVRTNNAAAVADGGTKPTSVYTYAEIEDRLRYIAHLSEAFPIRYLADYAGLSGVLDSEMISGVQHEIERLIIEGDPTGGNAEEWLGVLNVTGTTDVAFADDFLTTCRKARTALSNKGVRPTAWAFNPADLETVDLMRENTGGDGGFLVNSAAAATIFGSAPRVPSTAVPAGTAILADWRAVHLLVREDASTLAATQSGDLFARNQALLRAEGRFLAEIVTPDAIAVVHLEADDSGE